MPNHRERADEAQLPQPIEAVAGFCTDTEGREDIEALRHEVKRRDRWLRLLAHELRSPLMSLLGAADAIAREDDDARIEAAQNIKQQVHYMTQLLTDSLHSLEIDDQEALQRRAVFDLRSLIPELENTMRPLAKKFETNLAMQVPNEAVWIDAERTQIKQVLVNLLTNAVKHTPEGKRVRLVVRSDWMYGSATISVVDEGVGIQSKDLKRIFQPFFRAAEALHDIGPSTGLGLALVQRIVHAHEGEVIASSPGLGKGSVFSVRLPLTRHAPRE